MERQKARKKAEEAPPRAPASRARFYKIGDVCSMTDTQPYVLRFWESEFPQLAPGKSRSGQRIYTDADIGLVQKIKTLLYEEEYTIAGARRKLEEEGFTAPPTKARAAASAAAEPPREAAARVAEPPRVLETIRHELQELKKLLES